MKLLSALCILIVLSACGRTLTPEDNQRLYKVGKPYQIGNRWYHPKEDPYYDEVGEASWYGPGFHGKKTANGEDFDKYDLTAAHRTLPMPCIVRVTNLNNGKSVKLRINDRGPFARDRIIDVSKKAAEVLGFHLQGMAHVRVEFLPDETAALFGGQMPESTLARAQTPKPKSRIIPMEVAEEEITEPIYPAPKHVAQPTRRTAVKKQTYRPSKPAYRPSVSARRTAPQSMQQERSLQSIVVGNFRKKENANRVASDVSRFGVAKMEEIHQEGKRFFRVRVGPFTNMKDANRVLNLIQQSGYNDAQFIRF